MPCVLLTKQGEILHVKENFSYVSSVFGAGWDGGVMLTRLDNIRIVVDMPRVVAVTPTKGVKS